MKHFLIIAFVTLFTCKALAQNEKVIDASKAALPISKWVMVTDSVYGYKATTNAMIVYLGGSYPNQRLTVVLKGDAITESSFFSNKVVIASGTVVKHNRMKEIIITSKEYFLVKQSDTTGSKKEIYKPSPGRAPLTAKQALTMIGKKVHIKDTVYDYKVINAKTVLLYLGSKAPDSTFIVVLKNWHPKFNLNPLLGGLDIDGLVTIYDHKPAVVWDVSNTKYTL